MSSTGPPMGTTAWGRGRSGVKKYWRTRPHSVAPRPLTSTQSDAKWAAKISRSRTLARSPSSRMTRSAGRTAP
jgi:hypothetical protein